MPSDQTSRRAVYFLVHVPKCAGTTVEWHFQNHLGPRFLWAPRWRNPLRDVIGNRYPGLNERELADVRVVSGHSLSVGLRAKFPDAVIRECVVLRDPVSWHLSMYNYRLAGAKGAEGPGFARWYGTVRSNPISRFLLNRYFEIGIPALYGLSSHTRLEFLERRLARFAFIGGLHRTDEMIAGVARSLDVPATARAENTIPSKRVTVADLPAGMLDRIRSDNRLDQALYDRWSERGWQGAPADAPPPLPRFDHGRYLAGDIRSAVLRELG